MKKTLKQVILRASVFAGILLIIGLSVESYRIVYQPLLSDSSASTTVKVPPGTGVYHLSKRLQEKGLLAHPYFFSIWAQLTGRAEQLKAGEYRIDPGMSATDLLAHAVKGDVVEWSITFVEGWTFRQVKDALLSNKHLLHTLDAFNNKQLMEKMGNAAQHPEGLFFPDTYYFIWGDTDINVLLRAYQKMNCVLGEAWAERDKHLPYKTPYQALIAASLIEKETAIDAEREKIAGVIVRRLKKRMKLQIDPTVLYGLGKSYDAPITRSDLKKKTPYNTYQMYGLPPTPIDMPGKASIIAALHPDTGKALYYMSCGDGSHVFSETYSDHKKAVKRYRELMKTRQPADAVLNPLRKN